MEVSPERLHRILSVLRRLASDPRRTELILRGGSLSQQWLGDVPRGFEDLDFLAAPSLEFDAARALTQDLLTPLEPERVAFTRIWEDSHFPGLRAEAWFADEESPLQVDTSFSNPLALPLQTWELEPGVSLLTPAPEEMFAWKLHGLFEFEKQRWRNKDLQDLYLYVQHLSLDPAALRLSIPLAFHSCDLSVQAVRRLLEGELGRSAGSQRRWRHHRRHHPEIPLPDDPAEAADAVANFIQPVMTGLLAEEDWP